MPRPCGPLRPPAGRRPGCAPSNGRTRPPDTWATSTPSGSRVHSRRCSSRIVVAPSRRLQYAAKSCSPSSNAAASLRASRSSGRCHARMWLRRKGSMRPGLVAHQVAVVPAQRGEPGVELRRHHPSRLARGRPPAGRERVCAPDSWGSTVGHEIGVRDLAARVHARIGAARDRQAARRGAAPATWCPREPRTPCGARVGAPSRRSRCRRRRCPAERERARRPRGERRARRGRARTSGLVLRRLLVVTLRRRQLEAGRLRSLGGGEPHLGLGLLVVRAFRRVVQLRVGVALDRETLRLRAVLERGVAALAVRRLVRSLGRLLGRCLGGGLPSRPWRTGSCGPGWPRRSRSARGPAR